MRLDVFAKVLPSTKTLPPATSALLEKLRTATPELATATPTAAADSERSGPSMTSAPSWTACRATVAAVAGLPSVL
jgi:hypothetical protein